MLDPIAGTAPATHALQSRPPATAPTASPLSLCPSDQCSGAGTPSADAAARCCFGRSLLNDSTACTPRASATDRCGTTASSQASGGVSELATLSPTAPTSMVRLLPGEGEEPGGRSRGGRVQHLQPSSIARSYGTSATTLDSDAAAAAGSAADGKSRAASSIGVSDAFFLPQSDTERLLLLSFTCRRSVNSACGSRNASELSNIVDPFAGCDVQPYASIRAGPTRPRGRRSRPAAVVGSLTSFGTAGGTLSSSDTAPIDGAGAGQRSRSAMEDLLQLTRATGSSSGTDVCPSSGGASTATMRSAVQPSAGTAARHAPAAPRAGRPSTSLPGTASRTATPTSPSQDTAALTTATTGSVTPDASACEQSADLARQSVPAAMLKQHETARSTRRRQATAPMGGLPPSSGSSAAKPARTAAPAVAASAAVAPPPCGSAALPHTSTPTLLSGRVPSPASLVPLEGSVSGVSALVDGGDWDLPCRGSVRWLEQQRQQHREHSFVRSPSILSAPSSSVCRGSSGAALAARSGHSGHHAHSSSLSPSVVDLPPFVGGTRITSFCSFVATAGVRTWVEEMTVDAPLDVCATTVSSLLRKHESLQLRATAESASDFGGSNLSRGLEGVLRSHGSFGPSRLGVSGRTDRSAGSAQQQQPMMADMMGPPMAFASSTAIRSTVLISSSSHSVVGFADGDGAAVTTTSFSSTTRLTGRLVRSQAGPSGAFGNEEEESAAVVRDVMLGSLPVRGSIATGVDDCFGEADPSQYCRQAVDAMLAHPDAPPCARAAVQRLHGVPPPPPPPSSASPASPRGTAKTTMLQTMSIHSYHSATVSSVVERGHVDAPSSGSLVPLQQPQQPHDAKGGVHADREKQTLLALRQAAEIDAGRAVNPLCPRSVGPLGHLSDSQRLARGEACLTSTEVHLPKLLPPRRSRRRFSVKALFGL